MTNRELVYKMIEDNWHDEFGRVAMKVCNIMPLQVLNNVELLTDS